VIPERGDYLVLFASTLFMDCYVQSVNKQVTIRKCPEYLSQMLISSSEFCFTDLNSTKHWSLCLTATGLFTL